MAAPYLKMKKKSRTSLEQASSAFIAVREPHGAWMQKDESVLWLPVSQKPHKVGYAPAEAFWSLARLEVTADWARDLRCHASHLPFSHQSPSERR